MTFFSSCSKTPPWTAPFVPHTFPLATERNGSSSPSPMFHLAPTPLSLPCGAASAPHPLPPHLETKRNPSLPQTPEPPKPPGDSARSERHGGRRGSSGRAPAQPVAVPAPPPRFLRALPGQVQRQRQRRRRAAQAQGQGRLVPLPPRALL